MIKWFSFFLLTCCALSTLAQSTPLSYEDKKGNPHLLGNIERSMLELPPYEEWFEMRYNQYELEEAVIEKINAFHTDDVKVKVYLGTWCGDSKQEVTRFLKIVDHSNIEMSAVEMIGLDNRPGKTKQGPNGEEKGLNIHRVPTFIFYKADKEIGRIVEFPMNSLEKDIAQIYAGLAPEPNYQVANYMGKLFQEKSIEQIDTFLAKNIRYFKHKSIGEHELNTLGYVLLAAREVEKAVVVFKFNTLLYPESGNVFDSLGEAYMKAGDTQSAIENYMRSYQLDPQNANAMQMVKEMIASKDHG
ncbi:MAG: hypothetical protein DHS20C18_48750 [Saprospiraceae bacterium]|nr:MAG: hypothetical protein DHS20C18_48750 [Saprospiraceae bacterium]